MQLSRPWGQYWDQLKHQDRSKSAAANLASVQKKAVDEQLKRASRAAAADGVDGGGDSAEQQAIDEGREPAAVANAAAGKSSAGAPAAVNVIDRDEETWEDCPLCTKAAKRARADTIANDRTFGRVASAMEKLGDAMEQQTMMMAFSPPFMRETSMMVAYWAHQTKKMRAKEGVKVSRGDLAAAGGVSGDATDGDGGVAPPSAGAAAGGSPGDVISASGEVAMAEASLVIAVDDDGAVFLGLSDNMYRAKSSDASKAAAEGASPGSAVAECDSQDSRPSKVHPHSQHRRLPDLPSPRAHCQRPPLDQLRHQRRPARRRRPAVVLPILAGRNRQRRLPLLPQLRLPLLRRRLPQRPHRCGRPVEERRPLMLHSRGC